MGVAILFTLPRVQHSTFWKCVKQCLSFEMYYNPTQIKETLWVIMSNGHLVWSFILGALNCHSNLNLPSNHIHNCREHAHTRPPLAQITVRGEKKFGHPTLYRKCIGTTQWCADKPINYSPHMFTSRFTKSFHVLYCTL